MGWRALVARRVVVHSRPNDGTWTEMMATDVVFEEGGVRLPTTWPHCRRCGAPMRLRLTLCPDCSDNDMEKAASYGGTATEITARYLRGQDC
jgi:hypothetical protein